MTRINFGLHASEGKQFPFETVIKCVGYNYLCAKRHFEHAFLNKPEIFYQNKWTTTLSENVKEKKWHVAIGALELIPVIGLVIALIERFFKKNTPLPEVPKTPPDDVKLLKLDPEISSISKNSGEIEEKEERNPPLNSVVASSEDSYWLTEVADTVAKSPFKDSFFDIIPKDGSLAKDLSELELKALKSIETLTELLGLTKPLSELPKFPVKLDNVEALWNLNSFKFMNSIQNPISFDLDGDGWPFIIIKVLSAKDKNISRAIFLYCGPLGSHCIQWDGWWEEHRGSSCPSFFSERQFINQSGDLMKYDQSVIQRFKDLMTKGEAEDDHKNKWILAV